MQSECSFCIVTVCGASSAHFYKQMQQNGLKSVLIHQFSSQGLELRGLWVFDSNVHACPPCLFGSIDMHNRPVGKSALLGCWFYLSF